MFRARRGGGTLLVGLPWLLLVIVAYDAIAIMNGSFERELVRVPLISGATWVLRISDVILAAALILLFVEILKATRTGGHSLVDHAISMIVFVICLIQFLVWDKAGTSLFFLITLVALIDVIAGFSVTIRAARRDFAVGPDVH